MPDNTLPPSYLPCKYVILDPMVRRFLLPVLVVGGIIFAACGSDGVDNTTNAPDTPATTEADTGSSEDSSAVETTAAPAHGFESDVLPILQDVCASCHAPGGPGSTHWELETAVDAASAAAQIAQVTSSKWMPPWPASDISIPFLDDLSLSDEQISTLAAWADAGGAIDVDPDMAIEPSSAPQFIDEPDLTLTSAQGPYTGSTEVLDDYRCMIFDPQVTEGTEWILASQFEPDQTTVVHHAIVTLHDASFRERAEKLSAAEEGPGYTCYGTSLLEGPFGGGYQLNAWAPGTPPTRMPDGYGIPINEGDFVIVQIHYHFDEAAPTDDSRMVFEFADEEHLAAHGGELVELDNEIYLAPAEIPCVEGDTHPLCDRDAAAQRVNDLYGFMGTGILEVALRGCGAEPADFAEMTTGQAWSTCVQGVRNPGRLQSVFGHMHELGMSYRLTLNPGEPDERVLLDIPDWDFDWQFIYQPSEEIVLKPTDKLLIECAWDRARAPWPLEGYVLWAEGTSDEMCYTVVTTAP